MWVFTSGSPALNHSTSPVGCGRLEDTLPAGLINAQKAPIGPADDHKLLGARLLARRALVGQLTNYLHIRRRLSEPFSRLDSVVAGVSQRYLRVTPYQRYGRCRARLIYSAVSGFWHTRQCGLTADSELKPSDRKWMHRSQSGLEPEQHGNLMLQDRHQLFGQCPPLVPRPHTPGPRFPPRA